MQTQHWILRFACRTQSPHCERANIPPQNQDSTKRLGLRRLWCEESGGVQLMPINEPSRLTAQTWRAVLDKYLLGSTTTTTVVHTTLVFRTACSCLRISLSFLYGSILNAVTYSSVLFGLSCKIEDLADMRDSLCTLHIPQADAASYTITTT